MQSALNRQALQGDVNPLFKKFVHEGENPTTYIPATKRREIYDYMGQVNYTKHLSPQKNPKSTQQEAVEKAAAQRTDFSVGVEGNANKGFQAQQLIRFGEDQKADLRMRATAQNVGPNETSKAYAYTSKARKIHQQSVYSVNIPFSKFDRTPQKPVSASSPEKANMAKTSTFGFSKSHASNFGMSPQHSVTGTSNFGHDPNNASPNAETIAQREKNMQNLTASSVKIKFPENSPYNVNVKAKEFKPNQNRKEMILNAKKADFQGQLLNSSVKFTFDEKNNKMEYNNNAGGGGDKDLIYNIKARKPDQSWAEQQDKASKNHLTQMSTLNANKDANRSHSQKPHAASENRFQTITDSYFSRARDSHPSPQDKELLKNHYKFHKGTTYSIGNPRDRHHSVTLAQESFVAKTRQDTNAEILPGRRNQGQLGIHNQNIVPNYAIGQNTPAVRGSDATEGHAQRSNSTYNKTLQGNFTNQFVEANVKNKKQNEFIHSNKFAYGYDPNGGHRALSMDKSNASKRGGPENLINEREAYKKRDEKQSFKIHGTQKMQNSDAKRVGDTLDRFVKNEIDEDFLKRSHLPFNSVKHQIATSQRPQMNTSFGMNPATSSYRTTQMGSTAYSPNKTGEKVLAQHFKQFSEVGNVPFSVGHRGRGDDARDRNNTLTKTSFAWKAPTVMN